MRLVLDTNIVMDLLHFGDRHTHPLKTAIANGGVQCFTDTECLAELERVTGYPEFGLTPERQRLCWKPTASSPNRARRKKTKTSSCPAAAIRTTRSS